MEEVVPPAPPVEEQVPAAVPVAQPQIAAAPAPEKPLPAAPAVNNKPVVSNLKWWVIGSAVVVGGVYWAANKLGFVGSTETELDELEIPASELPLPDAAMLEQLTRN